MTQEKPLAAIRYSQGMDVDPAFDTFVDKLRTLGLRPAGFLQRQEPDGPGCCPVSHLEDLASGTKTRITQPLGSGSTGCRLDPGALANAAECITRQLDKRPDLLILNRFGRGEAEGRGFRPAIERAVDLGIPVLTAVKDRYIPAWQEFSVDLAEELAADPEQMLAWLLPQLRQVPDPLMALDVLRGTTQ
ncbi:DUF2478 domain-containing protein [Roseibium sp. HPY-6]|uniref:DUF2478 domain-containing protein n=1 Tax=Roseibium sp. HPY-6 TaxID=3229852 RepID=UPI00338E3C09